MYKISGFFALSEEDNFQEGCSTDNYQDYYSAERFEAPTIPELIEIIKSKIGANDNKNILINACGEADRIDAQVYESEPFNMYPPTATEMELWKEGKKKIFLTTYTFEIELCTPVDVKSLVDATLYSEG